MGWTNSHLYEIRARDVGWGRPGPHFGDGPLDASKARLIDLLEDVGTRSLKYLYDFGDGWEHSIRIERITDAIPGMAYPCLIEAAGRCPPEDVGGPWGYRDFLDAIADPNWPSALGVEGCDRMLRCCAAGDLLPAGSCLGRGAVADGRVQALPIVENLDVVKQRGPGLVARGERGGMDTLLLQRGEEAFHG